MSLNTIRDATESTVQLVETESAPGGHQLLNSYHTNKVDHMNLVAMAQEMQKADSFIHASVSSKLQVIAEQVRFLQEQARKVLEEAKNDADLHHVACNFVKKPGKLYYLYQRPSGQRYFSILSPEEWGATCPHEYLGSYRLEADHSWTPGEKLEEKTIQQLMTNKILTSSKSLSITMDQKH